MTMHASFSQKPDAKPKQMVKRSSQPMSPPVVHDMSWAVIGDVPVGTAKAEDIAVTTIPTITSSDTIFFIP
jgi:hypothetical protein